MANPNLISEEVSSPACYRPSSISDVIYNAKYLCEWGYQRITLNLE